MQYHFDTDAAQKYGVNEAIVLNNIQFWVNKNAAGGNNFNDGRYWTRCSLQTYTNLFPFWTEPQIKRILKGLEDKGAITVGNYNKLGYDRTKWYALTDEALEVLNKGDLEKSLHKSSNRTDEIVPSNRRNRPFQQTKSSNRTDEIVSPIKDINQDIKEYINQDKNPYSPQGGGGGFDIFWQSYPKKVAKAAAEKSYRKLKPSADLQATILSALSRQKQTPQWTKANGQFIPNASTWLNQRRWEDEVSGPVVDDFADIREWEEEQKRRPLMYADKEGLPPGMGLD